MFVSVLYIPVLVLRGIALISALSSVLFANWRKKRPIQGIGDVAVQWLALTWISTVILGVPVRLFSY